MDLPDSEFVSMKKSLESHFKPLTLIDVSDKYWFEISNRSFRFDRAEMDVNILQNLEKSDLLTFSQVGNYITEI